MKKNLIFLSLLLCLLTGFANTSYAEEQSDRVAQEGVDYVVVSYKYDYGPWRNSDTIMAECVIVKIQNISNSNLYLHNFLFRKLDEANRPVQSTLDRAGVSADIIEPGEYAYFFANGSYNNNHKYYYDRQTYPYKDHSYRMEYSLFILKTSLPAKRFSVVNLSNVKDSTFAYDFSTQLPRDICMASVVNTTSSLIPKLRVVFILEDANNNPLAFREEDFYNFRAGQAEDITSPTDVLVGTYDPNEVASIKCYASECIGFFNQQFLEKVEALQLYK